MRRGFMDFVATILIPDFPGEAALWYATRYLEESGSDGSDAKHPEQSLANTLSKQVQTGRERRVRRERKGGVYRYFPVSEPSASESSKDIVVQLSLSTQELEGIDNLVAVGKFGNRDSAIKWLVTEGATANRGYLEKVANIRNRIERLKRDV